MSIHAKMRFEATPAAVREARRFVDQALPVDADPSARADMVLVVSELATNAVRHAATAFDVVIDTNGVARIEVEDGSPDLPAARPSSLDSSGERGLHIVERACDRWGVRVEPTRKCVWCERDLAPKH